MRAALSVALILFIFPVKTFCHKTTGTVIEFLPQYDLSIQRWTFKGAWSNTYDGYTMKCYETNEYNSHHGHWYHVALVFHKSRAEPLGVFSVQTCVQAALCRSIIVKSSTRKNPHRVIIYDIVKTCSVYVFRPPSTTVDRYNCRRWMRPASTRRGDHGWYLIKDQPGQPSLQYPNPSQPTPVANTPQSTAPTTQYPYSGPQPQAAQDGPWTYSSSEKDVAAYSSTADGHQYESASDGEQPARSGYPASDVYRSPSDDRQTSFDTPWYDTKKFANPTDPPQDYTRSSYDYPRPPSDDYSKATSQGYFEPAPHTISHSLATYDGIPQLNGDGRVILVFKTRQRYSVLAHDEECC